MTHMHTHNTHSIHTAYNAHTRCAKSIFLVCLVFFLMMGEGKGGRCPLASHEWDRVQYKFLCVPYEQVLIDGGPATVFTVLPHGRGGGGEPAGDDTEWMYELADNVRAGPPLQCFLPAMAHGGQRGHKHGCSNFH